jgi:hypothetical protein
LAFSEMVRTVSSEKPSAEACSASTCTVTVEPHVGRLGETADDLVDDLRELGDGAARVHEADLAVEAADAGYASRFGAGLVR